MGQVLVRWVGRWGSGGGPGAWALGGQVRVRRWARCWCAGWAGGDLLSMPNRLLSLHPPVMCCLRLLVTLWQPSYSVPSLPVTVPSIHTAPPPPPTYLLSYHLSTSHTPSPANPPPPPPSRPTPASLPYSPPLPLHACPPLHDPCMSALPSLTSACMPYPPRPLHACPTLHEPCMPALPSQVLLSDEEGNLLEGLVTNFAVVCGEC